MDDARCFELFTVYKIPPKEIAQMAGTTYGGVTNAIWRHRNAEKKRLTAEKRQKLKEFREAEGLTKWEKSERRRFDKEFPNAPKEWWTVWKAAAKKPSK